MQTIAKLFSLFFFTLEIGTVVGYLFVPAIQENRLTPVFVVFAGLFCVVFFFAGMVEKHNAYQPQPQPQQTEELHRAYQAGYSALERNQERQERAYQAQLESQERQHTTTVNAFVALSMADKQLLCEALRAGIRLVEANSQLFLRFANGSMQPVAQMEDMTPDKCRYMAAAQQRIALSGSGSGQPQSAYDGNVVDATFREV